MKMKMKQKVKLLAFAALTSLAANTALAANFHSLEASINNKAIHAEYERNVPSTNNLVMNLGYTYSQKYKNKHAHIGTLGLQGMETNNRSYRVAIGGKLYFYDFSVYSGAALAFGGAYYHAIPNARRFSLGGHAWIAPQVTSFGNTERIIDVGVRAAYQVINSADVFVGYRLLKLKNDKSGRAFDDDLESAAHLGFRLNF